MSPKLPLMPGSSVIGEPARAVGSRKDVQRYVGEKLRQPNTYVISFVVGSLLNVYGHMLVPWLRGQDQLLSRFAEEFLRFPFLVSLSIAIAYMFPLLVGLYSSVSTRYAYRDFERRAQFPDSKPDPVFKANSDGQLLDMGATTQVFFSDHGIKTANQFLGDELWARLASGGSGALPAGSIVYCDSVESWYVISYCHLEDESINVYVSQTVSPEEVAARGGLGSDGNSVDGSAGGGLMTDSETPTGNRTAWRPGKSRTWWKLPEKTDADADAGLLH